MKLNKTQIEYAFKRVDDAVKQKLQNKVGDSPGLKAPAMSFEEKYKAIASGDPKQAVLQPLNKINRYTDLSDAYTYPAHQAKREAAMKPQKAWDAKRDAALKSLLVQAQKIKDKIMLSGDADAALALIDKFAEGS